MLEREVNMLQIFGKITRIDKQRGQRKLVSSIATNFFAVKLETLK